MQHDIDRFLDLFYPNLYSYQRTFIISFLDNEGNFKRISEKIIIVPPRGHSVKFMIKIMEDYHRFMEKVENDTNL